jgi:hypothetical protein
MRLKFCLLLLLASMAGGNVARGIFMMEELDQVPVARVITNLQQKLVRNTNDFEVTYQLARAHSMAYATNAATVSVQKDTGYIGRWATSFTGVPDVVQSNRSPEPTGRGREHLTNAIVLFERARVLLRQSTNASSWQILRTELGLAWCLDQAGQREKALRGYRTALRVSWKQEVTGEFDFKEWLAESWDDVKSGRNPIHPQQRGHIGVEGCYGEEIIGYLMKLLDAKQDASEIADLKQKQTILKSMPRAITPILVPLAPGLVFRDLVNPGAAVKFDLDGSGGGRSWGWLTTNAAWLVYDSGQRGRITSGLQMFGNVTFWNFWPSGYAALEALDDDANGELSGDELAGIALWADATSDGVSEPGEVVAVRRAGVVAISHEHKQHPEGFPWSPCGIRFTDGSTRPTYDWIVSSRE